MSKVKINDEKLFNAISSGIKKNPIMTIWTASISPFVATIAFDVYNNGFTDRLIEFITTIAGIYVAVIFIMSIFNWIDYKNDTKKSKVLMELSNQRIDLENQRIQASNQHIIDMANEEAKIQIIKRVADLDYHLRLYKIYSAREKTPKTTEMLETINMGIHTLRKQLDDIDIHWKVYQKMVFDYAEGVDDKSSSVPSTTV